MDKVTVKEEVRTSEQSQKVISKENREFIVRRVQKITSVYKIFTIGVLRNNNYLGDLKK